MTSPMVPSNLDLTDFDWMPFDFQRLFNSDTWALSTDAEKVAAITLWGKSWYQRPAGSLPSDDRILASIQFTGTGARWKKVKEIALRGWVLCDDGRYYHAIVCEKALEAWLEKLARRLSSGAGNKERWGIDFDPSAISADIDAARRFLNALNPHSRMLTRRKPPGIPAGKKNDPGGNANGNPKRVPPGSQETRTETYYYVGSTEASPEHLAALARDACLLIRQAGIVRFNASHPDLHAAFREGVTVQAIADTAVEALTTEGVENPFLWAISTARSRHAEGPRAINGATHANRSTGRKLSAVEQVEQRIIERRSREERPDDGTGFIEGSYVAGGS